MIRVLALYENGQSTSILRRCPSDFSSREEAGYSTEDYPYPRSNSKDCHHCEGYFDRGRYAAVATQAHLQARLPLLSVVLIRLAVNYTLCGDDSVPPPVTYITDWYDSR